MRVDIWSDVVCPWCAIGRAHLDAALEEFEHRGEVEVVWRSFELDPGAPPVKEGEYADLLARKYGTSVDGARAMVERMTAVAAAAGWRFDLWRARPGSSFDAHRLVHLGAAYGIQDAVKRRFLRAYLSEGEAIGLREPLERLAVEAGLPAEEVRRVLDGDAYAAQVRADEQEALDLQVTGVPLFLVDGRYAVPGAQPPDVLLRVLRQAWEARRPAVTVVGGDAAACGPDGCAV